MTVSSEPQQYQTMHGRAQRRVLGVVSLLLIGVFSVLVAVGYGTMTWTFVAAVVIAVLACFSFGALRREAVGLFVSREGVTVRGFLLPVTVDISEGVAARWDVQGDLQRLRVRTRGGRWRRVTYMNHVTKGSPLRRFYPQQNQVVVRVPGHGWKPIGVVWTDESGADDLIAWLNGTRDQNPKREESLGQEDRTTSSELVPLVAAVFVPIVAMFVIVGAFDASRVLLGLNAVVLVCAFFWAYRRLDLIAASRQASPDERD